MDDKLRELLEDDELTGLQVLETKNTKLLEFFMPMIPPTVTAQEHKVAVKNGKPVFYDTPRLKAARDKLMSNLYKHKPKKPYTCGLQLVVKWCFPARSADGKRKHKNGEYRITKPDTDNLQKLLKDCMTRCVFWKDDALIASEVVEKFWADLPGIWIEIYKLP